MRYEFHPEALDEYEGAARSALAPSDNPVNSFEIETDYTKEWFARQEADRSGNGRQEGNSFINPFLIFDRCPHPDMLPSHSPVGG